MNWPSLARLAGLLFLAAAALSVVFLFLPGFQGAWPPAATFAGSAFVASLGAILLDAARLRERITGSDIAGWALLSLAAVSAAAVAGYIPAEPRIAIAFVFSAGFLAAGAAMRLLAAPRERRRRNLRSAREARDDADGAMTGGLEWRDGALPEEAARGGGLLAPLLWLAAAMPFIPLGLFAAAPFFAFALVPGGIGVILLWLRRRGRARLGRFGTSRIVSDDFPLKPGAAFRGALEIPAPPQAGEIDLSLRCIRIRRDPGRFVRGEWRSGVGLVVDRLHETTKRLPMTRGRPARTDFEFDLPANLPGASARASPKTLWLVEARAEGSGYFAEFRLPVRR